MANVPHLYRRDRPSWATHEVVERVLTLEARQKDLGVQSIYTLRHLAHVTAVDYNYLRSITSRSHDGYSVYEVSKRSGRGKRSIAAPEAPLAVAQRWLLDNVFGRLTANAAGFAYTRGRSAVSCAREHVGARWLLKLDLRDFFHQIDETQVYSLLRSALYEPLVAFEIARICTRLPDTPQDWLPEKYAREPGRKVGFPYAKARLGYLPQGAPTSGAISNLVANDLDLALTKIASVHQLVYTRYADDISMSSASDVPRTAASDLIAQITRAIQRSGFELNAAKTRLIGPGASMRLLGVLIDGEQVRISGQTRRRIEYHLRGMEKFGAVAHGLNCGFRDTLGMQNHVRGLIDYANDVDPVLARAYLVRFRRLSML